MEMNLMEGRTLEVVGGAIGARISLKNADRVAIVFIGATMASVVLQQHTADTAGTTKTLEIKGKVYHKSTGADFKKIDADPLNPVADLGVATAGDDDIVVVEVLAEDLDVNEGFAYVSVNGAAGSLYLLGQTRSQPAYTQAVV